jgi:predicted DNA-binding transcriptional regulator YafY
MTPSFSRHEQFLRIFALLSILSTSRQPLDDQSLIAAIKERLGLTRLSSRTLHRDCVFLVSCGYPVEHAPLPGDRRYGWQLLKNSPAGRRVPDEPLTLLELVAFHLGKDLLRSFEGTVLWTGIESLRHKIERGLPAALLAQLDVARKVFQVNGGGPSRYAARPRLMSTLFNAIAESREIEIEVHVTEAGKTTPQRFHPHQLVVQPPKVQLLGFDAVSAEDTPPRLLDIARIEKVTPLDTTFVRRILRDADGAWE